MARGESSSNGQCFQLEAHVAFLLQRDAGEFIALRSGWRDVCVCGVVGRGRDGLRNGGERESKVYIEEETGLGKRKE